MEYQLVITGTIGSWWDSVSLDYVRYVLSQNKGKEVHVGFSSFGGYVKDGLELNQAFKDHGNVHAHAFGMNASISTIAMLGCKTIDIVKGSFFLIHNTSTVIDTYSQKNKDELDAYIKKLTKQKEDLATFDDVLAQMYADKTGRSKEECAAQMKKGNWMSAQEAVDFGLVDSIREDKDSEAATVKVTNLYMNNYTTDYKETGIPPLPKSDEQPSLTAIADSKGNPTPTFLEKTFQGVKNLFHKNNVKDNITQMSKPTYTLLAAVLGDNSYSVNDQGQVVLTGEQAQKVEDRLAKLEKDNKEGSDAINLAVPAIDKLKKKVKDLEAESAAKDEQIKNLQGSPANETNDNPTKGEQAPTAMDLYNLVKDI